MDLAIIVSLISCLGTVVTLFVTATGWVVTAFFQRRMLDVQLKAESERHAMQLFVPTRIERLKKLRDWFTEGLSILLVSHSEERNALISRYNKWMTEGGIELTHACLVEGVTVRDLHAATDTLGDSVLLCLVAMGDIISGKADVDLPKVTTIIHKALKRIDAFEEKEARGIK